MKDKVFDWQEDKSKIRSDGSKGGIWLKGKVISLEGALVGLDLGSRLIKVNVTKVQRDQQKVWEKRQRYMPMVEFVASIARYQLKHRRYFIMKIPKLQDMEVGLYEGCNLFQIHL